MTFCGYSHGRNNRSSKPLDGCRRCAAKLERRRMWNLPGTAVDTEDLDDLVLLSQRETFFKSYAGSLGLCGKTSGLFDQSSPSFENAVRILEDQGQGYV